MYIQGCYFEAVSFKQAITMFWRMDINENIYKSVVEPSYKKATR